MTEYGADFVSSIVMRIVGDCLGQKIGGCISSFIKNWVHYVTRFCVGTKKIIAITEKFAPEAVMGPT